MNQMPSGDIEDGSRAGSAGQNSHSSKSSSKNESTASGRSSSNVGHYAVAPSVHQVAAQETKLVKRTKCFVIVVLVFIMVGFSLGAYIKTTNDEIKSFESQFQEDADKVLTTMGTNLVRTIQASDAFVASITSMAAVTNQEWPFVIIPDFAVRTEKIRALANAVYVTTYHVIKPEEKEEWEIFTKQKGKAMVEESIDALETFDKMDWPIFRNYSTVDHIHDIYENERECNVGVNVTCSWLPQWQIQPTIARNTSPYNWDLGSVPPHSSMNKTAVQTLLDTHKVTITEAWLVSYEGDEEHREWDDKDAEWIKDFVVDGEEPKEPISNILYPILKDAHKQIEIGNEFDELEHDVVGVFAVAVYWRDTLRNILREGTNGIRVVFENPCNPTFTYEINGPDVVYIGRGDYHDEKHEDFVVKKKLLDVGAAAKISEVYSGIKVDKDFCQFEISVYPSEATMERHETSTPVIFSVVTALVFVCICSVFILYDFLVGRRHEAVMKTTVTTTA